MVYFCTMWVITHTHNRFTALCELVPEENLWTLCCKGRLREADTLSVRLDATQS